MNSKSKVKAAPRRQSREGVTQTSDGDTLTELEKQTIHLSALESSRESKRAEFKSLSIELKSLSEKLQLIRDKKTSIEEELHQLDDEIDEVEKKRNRTAEKMIPSRRRNRNDDAKVDNHYGEDQEFESEYVPSKHYAENLTQFVNGQEIRRQSYLPEDEFIGDVDSDDEPIPEDEFIGDIESDDEPIPKKSTLSMHAEELFTEPTQDDFFTDNEEKKGGDDPFGDCKPSAYPSSGPLPKTSRSSDTRPSSSGGGYPPLELVTKGSKFPSHKHSLSSLTENKSGDLLVANSLPGLTSKKASNPASGIPTLDHFFKPSENLNTSNMQTKDPSALTIFPPVLAHRYAQSNKGTAPPQVPTDNRIAPSNQQQISTDNRILPSNQQLYEGSNTISNSYIPTDNRKQQKKAFDRKLAHDRALASDDFEWSQPMIHCLQNTFGIQQFRDHQKEIINCTMSGDDAFVIMRTGGGKSLTYQLPALLEGRGPQRKVTLVISPLLSLIRDQEDQMNAFAPGSAISFTSGMSGGTAEQARRWGLVRDRDAGVCIIFVTPERVHQSNKLRGELEKLYHQGRLGRFVIDECHCACQWGHDFRPDYTKLGLLKNHFPDIPLIAVTATASDRVREDCCKILRLGTNYKLFRSSANRPNLTYIVKEKPDGKDAVVADMAEFILSKHKNDAGIIYTLSKKEAEEVAQKLSNTYNISARAFHSEISDSVKESVQRSWMKNKTQIVVATIAFGLGINKPDVRFVLHHTLSKSLEAYYQESGRAGRDGGPADCVLYYAPKDISRVLAMIHGQASESTFWSMVRYGQAHGNDAYCRQTILATLGDIPPIDERLPADNVEVKDVTIHSRIAARLVDWSAKDLTIQQLVTLWRGKEVPPFVEEHPPKDLCKDDCERLIVNLLVEDILALNFVFTSYSTLVYVKLGQDGRKFLNNPAMKTTMRFPIRPVQAKKAKAKAEEKEKAASSSSNNQWISTKKSKKAVTLESQPTTNAKKRPAANAVTKKKSVGTKVSNPISIVDDSDTSSEDELRPGTDFEPRAKARRVTDEYKFGKMSMIGDDSISSPGY